jgi:hypothetical protein
MDRTSVSDVVQDILQLEHLVTTELVRSQDEATLENTCLQDLSGPLETILELFTAMSLPGSCGSESHIEKTLSILTLLQTEYDKTFGALQNAQNHISSHVTKFNENQLRLGNFNEKSIFSLHQIRKKANNLINDVGFLSNNNNCLQMRLNAALKERKTQESLVLSMALQLSKTEENNLMLRRENKRREFQLMQLKTHIEGIKKWRSHWQFPVKTLSRCSSQTSNRTTASARDRASLYAETQTVKNIMQTTK